MGGGTRGERVSYAEQRYDDKNLQRGRTTLADYSKKPKVFISFHVEDEPQVNLLRAQAKDGKVEFTDYSVKEPFDEKWKTQCTERIAQSDMVVVMIGPETHQREAVDWEIRKANELGKPIIGIRIYRDENHRIPQALIDAQAKIGPWNLEAIQNQLDRQAS